MDEVIPQLYRSTYDSYDSILNETLASAYPETKERMIGLMKGRELRYFIGDGGGGRMRNGRRYGICSWIYFYFYLNFNHYFFQCTISLSHTATGIRVDGTGASTAWDDVADMIDDNLRHSLGSSFWYSRGMIQTYPRQFEQFYNENCRAK